jgi:hypothetical protein
VVGVGDFDRFLFVVGAPRCGTTTLSEFLKGHPDVAFPLVKEPHFFAQHDLRGLPDVELRERVERDYLGRFFPEPGGKRIAADCSVTYLYTPELLEPILRLWPKSRFVIALRDPLTMLPSLHQRLVFTGDENLTSFAKAWAAVPDRAAGRRIPRNCAEPRWLRYDEAARFGTYVERLFEVVGKERCLPMIFDDLRADPLGRYRKFMDFCGLEPVPGAEVTVNRPSRGVRIHWLQRLLKRPPAAVRNYVAGDVFLYRTANPGADAPAPVKTRSAIMSLRKRLLRWNKVDAPDQPLALPLQLELRARLKDEIDRLGKLIGRDLSHWLVPKERTTKPDGAQARSVA